MFFCHFHIPGKLWEKPVKTLAGKIKIAVVYEPWQVIFKDIVLFYGRNVLITSHNN